MQKAAKELERTDTTTQFGFDVTREKKNKSWERDNSFLNCPLSHFLNPIEFKRETTKIEFNYIFKWIFDSVCTNEINIKNK